jgi:BASS family bile acid:Na+ symporter
VPLAGSVPLVEDSVVASVVLPVALALIMATLGLSLTPADFRRVVAVPRAVAIGLANLLVIAPLLAFAVAELFDLPPELAVGLVLLGAAPGGTMANYLTHLARGDTALSVTMTALSSLAAVVTVPLFLSLSSDHFGVTGVEDPSMAGVVARVFLITLVPLAAGMALRRRFPPEGREGTYVTARRAAMTTFVAVVLAAVVSEHGAVLEHAAEVAGAALTLNVAAMTVSFTLAKLARLDDAQATAIAIELGMHNATLAIAVGASISTAFTIPAAVYSGFMFVTGGLFAWAMARRSRLSPPAPRPGGPAAATRPGPSP